MAELGRALEDLRAKAEVMRELGVAHAKFVGDEASELVLGPAPLREEPRPALSSEQERIDAMVEVLRERYRTAYAATGSMPSDDELVRLARRELRLPPAVSP